MNSKERLRLRLYLMLILVDLTSITASFILGNVIRLDAALHPQGLDMLVLLLPLYAALALDMRAYSVDVLRSPRIGIARALKALAIAFAIVMGFLFYMKAGPLYSRIALAVGMIGALTLLPAARHLFGNAVGRHCNWSFVNEVLLVDSVTAQPGPGQIVLFADREGLRPALDDPILLDRLGRLLRHCDRVIVACPAENRAAWSRMLKGIDVDGEVSMPELDTLGALEMRTIAGRTTLLVTCGPLGLRNRVLKRGFDVAVALPALALLAPVLLATAIAIRVESPGPVLFRQLRVGRGNRIFGVLKFRSMRQDASDAGGEISASRGDNRLTGVGRFIRMTSIDELPQLINVLKGEMSIVGPRPHALASTAGNRLFWAVDDRYFERHVVKPGITGLAQVQGFRGATETERDLVERLQADLDYLSGWTLWRDCKILLNTFRVVIHDRAY